MVSNELTYDILWQAYQKEKKSNELQLIPKTFYDDMKTFIEDLSGAGGADERLQRENATRLLNGIFERRKQKILMYAAYGRQMPTPAPDDETELYDNATKLIKSSTMGYKNGNAARSPLRSLQAIPEIILPSGGKIGPLEKDQVVEVNDKGDRLFLVNSKICKEL